VRFKIPKNTCSLLLKIKCRTSDFIKLLLEIEVNASCTFFQMAVKVEFKAMEKLVHDMSHTTIASMSEVFGKPIYRKQFVVASLVLINVQTVGFINILLYR